MTEPLIPARPEQIDAIAQASRRLVTKRALMAAGVAVLPVPGLDWLADVSVLMKVIPEISRRFGLSEEQLARLSPARRVAVYKALSAVGSVLAGRLVTRALVVRALRLVGVRLGAQQVAKFVPIAGQALSALLTFGALKYVCEQHIRQCEAVAREIHREGGAFPG
ncbi:MAG: hypothetical protein ABW067_20475 [Rhizobacter sp.]